MVFLFSVLGLVILGRKILRGIVVRLQRAAEPALFRIGFPDTQREPASKAEAGYELRAQSGSQTLRTAECERGLASHAQPIGGLGLGADREVDVRVGDAEIQAAPDGSPASVRPEGAAQPQAAAVLLLRVHLSSSLVAAFQPSQRSLSLEMPLDEISVQLFLQFALGVQNLPGEALSCAYLVDLVLAAPCELVAVVRP